MKLSDISIGSNILGLEMSGAVRIISLENHGEAITVVYKTSDGKLGEQTLFPADEDRLSPAEQASRAFNADPEQYKITLEALRIQLAYLFDPMMAVHTSNVEPLPHQITAVYESMLPRQPLRFVLADDPGAGKTIMAGLLIKELILRADARRILIIAPGSLTGQWQDELFEKFGMTFELFSREKQEQSVSGNYFAEQDRIIARLDQTARNEEYWSQIADAGWDLVIFDEAHKLSATYFGNEIKRTKRFDFAKKIGAHTRHLLLMTATPHNGKEEDFQAWLSLLDSDRFYGKYREGVHSVDFADMMRRMVKEDLVKFDGTPLFPERRAYTVQYELSDLEVALYHDVTRYVREEMNRADNLEDGKRKGSVGFALTILQRRLASSPEAIYQSIKRRRTRLENHLEETKTLKRGASLAELIPLPVNGNIPDFDDMDDELNASESEDITERLVDQATAARTIEELKLEIDTLKALEKQASAVVYSGEDRKWSELSSLLQDTEEMYREGGSRRKLIIFTEHRDTLNYLTERIRTLIGRPEAVGTIHGGTNRDERRKTQENFRNNPDLLILVATDAAGEGVNLQNANLMVNYDLPWNPNRIEQRFGRIHRIGQREVCHLWNLVARGTREGEVFSTLFDKLEEQRRALGGRVFDILGEAFEEKSLKQLLIDAIRYGDLPETKAKLNQVIDGALDLNHIKSILSRNALVEHSMSLDELFAVKEEMEKAEARKLQPHFIRAFFIQAFGMMNGQIREREKERYEVPFVPAAIRERDRIIGTTRTPVLTKYERICFDRTKLWQEGKPLAELIHPGHPMMSSLLDLVIEQGRDTLANGTILIDPTDNGIEPRLLFLIDHIVREGSGDHTVSRRLQFVTMSKNGEISFAGWAPHLDFVAPNTDQMVKLTPLLSEDWISDTAQHNALSFALSNIAPEHYAEVKDRRERQIDKQLQAVHTRLQNEIDFWTDRYLKLKEETEQGRQPRMQPENARRRVDELVARLDARTSELRGMRHVVSSRPQIIGTALIVPKSYLEPIQTQKTLIDADNRRAVELIAMAAVTNDYTSRGWQTRDLSADKCGWDITAIRTDDNGCIVDEHHIEVKGRAHDATTITVTKNEICYALNQSDKFILAVVLVNGENVDGPHYIQKPFTQEPDWATTSVNYDIKELLARSKGF